MKRKNLVLLPTHFRSLLKKRPLPFKIRSKRNTGTHVTTVMPIPLGKIMNVPDAATMGNLPVLPVVQFWTYCCGKKSTTVSWSSPDISVAHFLEPVVWYVLIRQLLRQDWLQAPSLKNSLVTNYMSLQIIMASENFNI